LESFQSNVSIEDCVLPSEATYLNILVVHFFTSRPRLFLLTAQHNFGHTANPEQRAL
jgi:hypothetical protein